MSFDEEVRAMDPDRVVSLFKALFGPIPSGSETHEQTGRFLQHEIAIANEIPVFKALKEAVNAQTDDMERDGAISHDQALGLKAGIDVVRMVFIAYASEEQLGSSGVDD